MALGYVRRLRTSSDPLRRTSRRFFAFSPAVPNERAARDISQGAEEVNGQSGGPSDSATSASTGRQPADLQQVSRLGEAGWSCKVFRRWKSLTEGTLLC